MTRINANVDPKTLHRRHLIAEYREITMVPAALRRSLHSKSLTALMRSIPHEFTLNTGHVTFFYDKLEFLRQRFDALTNEMKSRGYSVDMSRKSAFDGFPPELYNTWTASERDNKIIESRISERISQKPHLYT